MDLVPENKLKVGILGATGMVGQRFITLLEGHPWFEVTELAASSRSAGKRYGDLVEGKWKMDKDLPERLKDKIMLDIKEVGKMSDAVDFVFSAVNMSKEEIRDIEDEYAKHETPVVSNNSAHRWTPDVPMVVPEINSSHFEILESQKKRLGTKRGFVAVKPNCSIQCYVPALAAWKEFGPKRVLVSTYQAISGAGKNFDDWPEMLGNIIPFISGEEEKSEKEPLKVFGKIEGDHIENADDMIITSQCLRVPVLNGHTASVYIDFENDPGIDTLIEKLESFKGYPQENDLPSAPKQFIKYMTEDDRPQVALDVDYERGFGVTIGRLRKDTLFDYKFIGLAHNTVRGAAGGALLAAETLVSKGYIQAKQD